MTHIVKPILLAHREHKERSYVAREGDFNEFKDLNLHDPYSFAPGLRDTLLQVFDDMITLRIYRIASSGFVSGLRQKPSSCLSEVVKINTDNMGVLTREGYVRFSELSEYGERSGNILRAVMLLVWKWSPHFSSDWMDGTNDFSSPTRTCVVCGRVHHRVRTGQLVGGVKIGFDPHPVREVIAHPYDHCFNPDCFSHEIEKMIDPAYVFVPPKPGEGPEGELAQAIKNDPSLQKYINQGRSPGKKNSDDDPAVKGFIRDMS